MLDSKQLTAVDKAIKEAAARRSVGGGPGDGGGAAGGGGAPGKGNRPAFDPAKMKDFNPYNSDKSNPRYAQNKKRTDKLLAFLTARAAGKAVKLDLPPPGGTGASPVEVSFGMRNLAPSVVLCCVAALGAAAQQPPKSPTRTVRRSPVYRPPTPPVGGVVAGSVIKADSTKGTLLISGRTSREPPQQVEVLPAAIIVKQFRASAADLKVGETIEVAGVPVQIDARTIKVGEVAPVPEDHPARAATRGAAPRPPAVQPQLLGKVTRVAPLSIELGAGVIAEVKVSGATTFTRVTRVPLNSLKAGDPVLVMGARNAAGTLVARRIQVGFEGFPGTGRNTTASLRSKPNSKPTNGK